jgi:putative transposase
VDEGPPASRPAPPPSQLKFLRDFLKSDKIKYRKAMALQKLDQDPEGISIHLKYHLLWNTAHRRPVFNPPKETFEGLSDLFGGYGELVGGMTALMWLAPDHVHVYVETEGRKSIETIQKKMKAASAKTILNTLPDVPERLVRGAGLWDKAYFVETIG